MISRNTQVTLLKFKGKPQIATKKVSNRSNMIKMAGFKIERKRRLIVLALFNTMLLI